MTYQDRLKTHLANYKRNTLNIQEPGLFLHSGRQHLKDHILPISDGSRNLLDEATPHVRIFLSKNPAKRHRYFHHLNSSQAFAFNFFFPYFYGGDSAASALLRALGQPGVFLGCEPEAIPVKDEGSNIDMLWTTADGPKTFCEVKLSESDFGKATVDQRHKNKFREHYEAVLAPHLETKQLEETAFFSAYQFNRNIWHMVRDDRDRLVFLLPRANTVLWSSLQRLLTGVRTATRNRIDVVAIEDAVDRLIADNLCQEKFRNYAIELKSKYVVT